MPDNAGVLVISREESELINGLDPLFRDLALAHRHNVITRGVPFRFVSGLRSLARQRELFESLPEGQAAKPGTSLHEIGFAYDIAGPTSPIQWDIAGSEGEALGLVWGGRFKTVNEPWHFQAPATRPQLARTAALRAMALATVVGFGFFVAKGK